MTASRHRAEFLAGIAAFLLASLGLLYYALRGGSYDLVVRQEEAIAVALLLGLACLLALVPRARPPRGWWLPLAALALLAVWTATSLSWTSSHERTLAELARVLHYLALLMLVLLVAGRGLWRPAVIGLAATAVAVCAVALAGRLFPSAVPANEVARLFRSDRLNYPLNYWNALAAWAAMAMTMLLALSAHTVRPALRSLALAGIPVCALAAYLTYSRQGIAGVALGVLVVLALGRNRWLTAVHALVAAGASALPIFSASRHDAIANATGTEGRGVVLVVLLAAMGICAAGALIAAHLDIDRFRVSRSTARAALAGAVAIALVAALTVGRHPISDAWHEFKTPLAPAAATGAGRYTNLNGHRYEYWQSAFKAFKAHPGDGIGAGTFEFWWNRHGGREFVRDAHSLYIETAAELGLPGVLLVLAFVVSLAALAIRARSGVALTGEIGAHLAATGAFLVYLLHSAIDWMWESTAVTVFALACAGLAASAGPAPPVRWRLPARGALVAAAAVICVVQLPGLLSLTRVRESSAAAAKGDLTLAAQRADDAVNDFHGSATPYVQRALVAEARGDLRGAIADTRRAIDRERLDWRHYVLLTRLEVKAGNAAAATHAYRRAAQLRPGSPFFQFFAPR
jgi:tetratricopeptide (TPR) repeat protein